MHRVHGSDRVHCGRATSAHRHGGWRSSIRPSRWCGNRHRHVSSQIRGVKISERIGKTNAAARHGGFLAHESPVAWRESQRSRVPLLFTGCIPLKVWLATEASRAGVLPISVYFRVRKGQYPGLQLLRLNQRVVFVLPGTAKSRRVMRRRGGLSGGLLYGNLDHPSHRLPGPSRKKYSLCRLRIFIQP